MSDQTEIRGALTFDDGECVHLALTVEYDGHITASPLTLEVSVPCDRADVHVFPLALAALSSRIDWFLEGATPVSDLDRDVEVALTAALNHTPLRTTEEIYALLTSGHAERIRDVPRSTGDLAGIFTLWYGGRMVAHGRSKDTTDTKPSNVAQADGVRGRVRGAARQPSGKIQTLLRTQFQGDWEGRPEETDRARAAALLYSGGTCRMVRFPSTAVCDQAHRALRSRLDQLLGDPKPGPEDQYRALLAAGFSGADVDKYRWLHDTWLDLGGHLDTRAGRGSQGRLSVHLSVELLGSKWGSAWPMTVHKDGSILLPLEAVMRDHGPFAQLELRTGWFSRLSQIPALELTESPQSLAAVGKRSRKIPAASFLAAASSDDGRAELSAVLRWYLEVVRG